MDYFESHQLSYNKMSTSTFQNPFLFLKLAAVGSASFPIRVLSALRNSWLRSKLPLKNFLVNKLFITSTFLYHLLSTFGATFKITQATVQNYTSRHMMLTIVTSLC